MNAFNLKSKTIRFRLVEETDAEFILSLRTDKRLNNFLSHVSNDLQTQIDWIRSYKLEEHNGAQYYFIIESLDGVKCGTVRVYDFVNDSFSWGSWVLNESKPRMAAVESALLVYEFGFNRLGFVRSHFEVMKGNLAVIRFHERFGAKKTGEDDQYYYFNILKEVVEAKKLELQKIVA